MDDLTQVLFGTVVFLGIVSCAGAMSGLALRRIKDHFRS
jgi:hypothetical protein